MKIVYLSSSIIPSRTANSIHVMNMCQAFAQNGHEVVLLAPDKKNDVEPGVDDVFLFYGVQNCFKIVKLPWLSIKGRACNYALLAALRAKALRPDLVYCREVAGCLFSATFGLTVMFESHLPIRDSGRISEWMFRGLIKSPQLQKLVVITHALKKYYESNYPLTVGKIQVAPDGANPLSERVVPIDLPNKGKRLQVGYVGHLYKGRGVDVIIDLAKTCSWADYHLVGGTSREINYWKNVTRPLKNIIFHGFVSPISAERWRVAFDVLLAPYQNDVCVDSKGKINTVHWMSPLKVFEYMAAGKAIICSDLPVIHEVLVHNRNAMLCPPDHVETWRTTLSLLRNDKDLRERLGKAVREDFLINYTWKARAKRFLN